MLVGRVSPAYRRELGDPGPNVWLAGQRPYHELPGLIAACDVCIVPHLRDELTATMDPLKLYEYAAAGKPVVSTVSSPNPALAGQAAIALGADAFAEAIAAEARDDDAARRMSASQGRRAGDLAAQGRPCPAGARRGARGPGDPAVTVWAVIVHYGDAAATARAVESLQAGRTAPDAILVVDNGGGLPELPGVEVMRPGRNIGFAAAVRAGSLRAVAAGADWVWVFNNDALAAEACLERLLAAAETAPRAALLSPVIAFSGRVGHLVRRRRRETAQSEHPPLGRGPEREPLSDRVRHRLRASGARGVHPRGGSPGRLALHVLRGRRLVPARARLGMGARRRPRRRGRARRRVHRAAGAGSRTWPSTTWSAIACWWPGRWGSVPAAFAGALFLGWPTGAEGPWGSARRRGRLSPSPPGWRTALLGRRGEAPRYLAARLT